METTRLYFECENCGQPFDIEIDSEDFKCIRMDKQEMGQKFMYEFKSEFHCCGKNIEIKIEALQYPIDTNKRHNISCRGLRNLRTDDNFNNIINKLCQNNM